VQQRGHAAPALWNASHVGFGFDEEVLVMSTGDDLMRDGVVA
jgi:hypothetical protein